MLRTLGILASIWMLVLALWGWNSAGLIVYNVQPARPDLLLWAIRCGVICLAAGAQVLVLMIAAQCLYRRDGVSDILRVSGMLISTIAGIGAVALGLAGR